MLVASRQSHPDFATCLNVWHVSKPLTAELLSVRIVLNQCLTQEDLAQLQCCHADTASVCPMLHFALHYL